MARKENMRIPRPAPAALLAACLALATAPAAAHHLHPVLDPARLMDRLGAEQSPPLIDVRTPGEYRAGHLPGAVNIPIQEFQRRFAELSSYRDREVVLYCETGARASYGGRWLKSLGFRELRFLDGHMIAWRRAGLPTEK